MSSEGFTPEPMHYRLNFSDGRLGGLQVTVRSVSIRRRIAFNKVRFAVPQNSEEADKYVQDIYAEFIDRLVDWNLRDEDGNKVPKTVDGLLDQHDYVVEEILKAWIGVIDAKPEKKEEQGPQDPGHASSMDPTIRDFDPSEIPMQTGIQET